MDQQNGREEFGLTKLLLEQDILEARPERFKR